MEIEINEKYKIFTDKVDKINWNRAIQPPSWKSHPEILELVNKYYSSYADLLGVVVTVVGQAIYDDGIIWWSAHEVKPIDHDFTFCIHDTALVPLDKTCTCDLRMLMSKGCQCGGA